MLLTKRFEFSYAHILPNHAGKCARLHGHNGVLEVTVSGDPQIVMQDDTIMSGSEGMIIDFGDLKQIVKDAVVDKWDHRFLAKGDEWPYDIGGPEHYPSHAEQFVVVGVRTTAENLAKLAFELIADRLPEDLSLEEVKFYETPDSWAVFTWEDRMMAELERQV